MGPLEKHIFSEMEFALLAACIVLPLLSALSLKPGEKAKGWITNLIVIVVQFIGLILIVPQSRVYLIFILGIAPGAWVLGAAHALGIGEALPHGIGGVLEINSYILFTVGCGLFLLPGLYLLLKRVLFAKRSL